VWNPNAYLRPFGLQLLGWPREPSMLTLQSWSEEALCAFAYLFWKGRISIGKITGSAEPEPEHAVRKKHPRRIQRSSKNELPDPRTIEHSLAGASLPVSTFGNLPPLGSVGSPSTPTTISHNPGSSVARAPSQKARSSSSSRNLSVSDPP
jgi:hypothetical protein